MTNTPQPAAWDITGHTGYQFLQEAQEGWEPSPGQYAIAAPLYSAETVAALQAQIDRLERLRPHWAKGYTSDSVAAQSTITALNQIWSILGVDDQTAAMDRLRQLTTTFAGWQPIDTAPKDGTHCILAVQSGAFIYSIQGCYGRDGWAAAFVVGNVTPLAWMPNVLLPDHLTPWDTTEDRT
jgi:hypothetical protein